MQDWWPTLPFRILELFSGIGGCAEAVAGRADVVLAVDQHELAMSVYARNHAHPQRAVNLASASAGKLVEADLWWMSPPCQPYTVRGARRDLDDRRADSFKRVLTLFRELRPRYLALENVPLFENSRAHDLLRETLSDCGYQVQERILCPTELGIPNGRRRFYLVAGPDLQPFTDPEPLTASLSSYLSDELDPALLVDERMKKRFGYKLHVVDRADPDAVAACFTRAYGNSPVYAGSYLRDGDVLRRFHPREIARLLGFSAAWSLPPDLPLKKGWQLVGNSLSVPAVRVVLSAIPGLDRGR